MVRDIVCFLLDAGLADAVLAVIVGRLIYLKQYSVAAGCALFVILQAIRR
jgi:hypothetical protein